MLEQITKSDNDCADKIMRRAVFKLIWSENVLDTDKDSKFSDYRVNLVLLKTE